MIKKNCLYKFILSLYQMFMFFWRIIWSLSADFGILDKKYRFSGDLLKLFEILKMKKTPTWGALNWYFYKFCLVSNVFYSNIKKILQFYRFFKISCSFYYVDSVLQIQAYAVCNTKYLGHFLEILKFWTKNADFLEIKN